VRVHAGGRKKSVQGDWFGDARVAFSNVPKKISVQTICVITVFLAYSHYTFFYSVKHRRKYHIPWRFQFGFQGNSWPSRNFGFVVVPCKNFGFVVVPCNATTDRRCAGHGNLSRLVVVSLMMYSLYPKL
jgi:hypothetical protein